MEEQAKDTEQVTELSKGLAAREAKAAEKPAESPASPPPSPESKPAETGKVDEVAELKKRLAALESGQDALQKKREAADALDTFIRDKCEGLPTEMMRKLLPATTDQKLLYAEANKVEKWLKAYTDELRRRGLITYVNIGGDPGGMPPSSVGVDMSGRDLIAAGLHRERRRPQ